MNARLAGIIEKLRHEETRWDAILELKLLQDKTIVSDLQAMLLDEDWVIRWCVAEKLGDIGDPASVSDLAGLLADPDSHVRKNAIKALQRYGVKAVPVAVSYFQHRDREVRLAVYHLLRGMGESILQPLEKVVFAQNWVVANRIIHLMWEIGGITAERTLVRLLVIPSLQKAIVLLLGSMKSAFALPFLLPLYANNKLKKPVLFAFKKTGERAFFEFIIHAYLRGDEKTQHLAEQVLAKVGHHIVPAFLNVLTTEPQFVDRILWICSRLDLSGTVKLLAKNPPKSPDVLRSVKAFLSQHKGKLPEGEKGQGGFFSFLEGVFK
jgi:hypothetical protein